MKQVSSIVTPEDIIVEANLRKVGAAHSSVGFRNGAKGIFPLWGAGKRPPLQ